jgi:hypothetical protein
MNIVYKVVPTANFFCGVSSMYAQSGAPSANPVESIINEMTIEEKIDYVGGTGFAVRAMPRLKPGVAVRVIVGG